MFDQVLKIYIESEYLQFWEPWGGKAVSPTCFEIGFCGTKKTNRTFSDHDIAVHSLPSVPNRVFANGKSRASCIFTQQGRKGVNQDAATVWEDFMSEDVTFCGVFDGHGPQGHLVAREVRDALPLKLLSSMNSYGSRQNKSRGSCLKGNLKKMDGRDSDKEALASTFHGIYRRFSSNYGIEGQHDSMVAIQLTVDLKPNLPREAERIKKCKVGSLHCKMNLKYPEYGFHLMMPWASNGSSFQGFCLKEYGVISIPEFSHRLLTERDQFIVLASDGGALLQTFKVIIPAMQMNPMTAEVGAIHAKNFTVRASEECDGYGRMALAELEGNASTIRRKIKTGRVLEVTSLLLARVFLIGIVLSIAMQAVAMRNVPSSLKNGDQEKHPEWLIGRLMMPPVFEPQNSFCGGISDSNSGSGLYGCR
ncbi:Photosystem II family protein [Hibiscus syriacus]|uniref:Photosystem II family protein n=1 Tax=Hibiscus syriacus TaxID=106335 RepID=A0A6A2Z5W7_HIBSY|nr:Photosystem II family protein [Hibiscus syriacus]